MNSIALAMLSLLIGVIPPLSPEQRLTLEGVLDRKVEIDEAFYSLMTNAAGWPAEDEVQGAGLNVKAVLASPAEYRGLPMLIEGEYMGLHEVHMVKKSGPWDGRLEQWGIRIPEADAAVMVFLVRPPPVPVVGQKVKLVGRFYKVWPVTDERTGQKLEYLVFVGNSAQVSAGLSLPPLTASEKRGLSDVVDFTEEISEGPFYQLMNNAMRSKDQPVPASPLITHPDPIIGAPADYRGMPLRAEGVLVRRQAFPTSRGGNWKAIEQWIVEISPTTRDKAGESVVVYLPDPPAEFKVGDKVSIVGRFYKIWRTYLAKGDLNEPYNFVVLAGHRVQSLEALSYATAPQGHEGTAGGLSGNVVRAAAGALVILGIGFYVVRRRIKKLDANGATGSSLRAILQKRKEERETQSHTHTNGDGEEEEEDQGPPLPADPAEALLEMERRKITEE